MARLATRCPNRACRRAMLTACPARSSLLCCCATSSHPSTTVSAFDTSCRAPASSCALNRISVLADGGTEPRYTSFSLVFTIARVANDHVLKSHRHGECYDTSPADMPLRSHNFVCVILSREAGSCSLGGSTNKHNLGYQYAEQMRKSLPLQLIGQDQGKTSVRTRSSLGDLNDRSGVFRGLRGFARLCLVQQYENPKHRSRQIRKVGGVR